MEAIENNVPMTLEKIDSDLPEDKVVIPTAPVEVNLPEISEPFCYLRELFFRSGQALQTGMGLIPLSWVEISTWLAEEELELMVWEKRLIKKMSEAYCAESSRATDPARPAPYTPEKVFDEEKDAADQIAMAVRFRETLAQFRKK